MNAEAGFQRETHPSSRLSRPALSVRDLRIKFSSNDGVVHAVNGVDLEVMAGDCLVVIGESGCGKSATLSAVLGLIPPSRGVVEAQKISLDGEDLLALSSGDLREVRSRKIGMIFQDPTAALDPTMRIGAQIGEVLRVHDGKSRREARDRAIDLLRAVGFPDPIRSYSSFPHELSGGMRQRVVIAAAIALDPPLLMADEPTTALDTTVQAQILDLLGERQSLGTALILVTHDLGVAARMADRVIVMYAGEIVEEGSVTDVLLYPKHPYTAALLACTPNPISPSSRLIPIPGSPPVLDSPPRGCSFASRCEYQEDICLVVEPPPVVSGPGRLTRCHFPEKVKPNVS